MIPLLSLMIGAYIFTRMLELIFKKQEKDMPLFLSIILTLVAIATIVVTVFCVFSILTSGKN
jgi:hypothetical protein